jgi:tripartite-type tricarboxylate transporter receptor subunit TctC
MKIVRRLLSPILIGSLFFACAGASVHAEAWPTRTIVLIFGFGPGGSGDLVSRRFAEYASKELGQPVIVENRPGAGGGVAANSVSKSAPDGYTIMMSANGPMLMRPLMDASAGYDPVKGFTPIGLVGEVPNVIVAGSKLPVRSLQELVDWAKKNPGLLTIGHPGVGTMGHLGALLLASKAGIQPNYIAYRDNTQMLPDILGGQIDVGVAAYNPPQKAAHILAVMSATPIDFLPGIPSMPQAGFPGIYASVWWALFGPPNLPPDIVAKLNAVMNSFLNSGDARHQMAAVGFQAVGGSPDQLAEKMAEEKVLWSKVIKDANISLNGAK